MQQRLQLVSNHLYSYLHNHLHHHIHLHFRTNRLPQATIIRNEPTEFTRITIPKRCPPTLGTFASTNIKLEKYVLPFKQPQASLINRSNTNCKSSTFTFTTITTTKPPPNSKMLPPTTKSSPLNTPTPSPTKDVL